MAIFKYLDLSTAHLSAETKGDLDLIDGVNNTTGLTVAKYDYGYFVSVPESVEAVDAPRLVTKQMLQADLREVLKFAVMIGCYVVRFDADAEVIDGLPVFEGE